MGCLLHLATQDDTIYTFDDDRIVSRLHSVDYYPADNLSAPAFRQHAYTYDLAGNRLSESISLNGGTPTVTSYTYNAANQISSQGFTYDANGNLTSDGTQSYVWDRANRLLSMGGISYAYDGLGSRISQTANSIVTQYLLDVQPGLVKVLAQTSGENTTRFVHGPRGILGYQNPSDEWGWAVQDGLGSVRVEVDDDLAVSGSQNLTPYGVPYEVLGDFGLPFGFTGEMVDENDLVYLRARYYNPMLGVFPSLDPVEKLNRYQYVSANPTNRIDLNGLQDDGEEGDEVFGEPGIAKLEYDTLSGTGMYSGWNLYSGWDPYSNSSVRVWMSPGISGLPESYELMQVEPGIDTWDSGTITASVSGDGVGQIIHPNETFVNVFVQGGTPQDVEWMLNNPSGSPLSRIGSAPELYSILAGPSGSPGGASITAPQVDPVLAAIAQGECRETPEPSAKHCDPAKVLAWMRARGGIEERGEGVAFDYQRRYAGRFKYSVPTGTGKNVVADGARASDCALIGTKYVGSPASSPYILGSRVRPLPFASDLSDIESIDYQENDQFMRYGLALRAPESVNPFVKLEVVTNNFAVVPYFQFWINKNNVPNTSFRSGPWP